jgi:hypothetical protein
MNNYDKRFTASHGAALYVTRYRDRDGTIIESTHAATGPGRALQAAKRRATMERWEVIDEPRCIGPDDGRPGVFRWNTNARRYYADRHLRHRPFRARMYDQEANIEFDVLVMAASDARAYNNVWARCEREGLRLVEGPRAMR